MVGRERESEARQGRKEVEESTTDRGRNGANREVREEVKAEATALVGCEGSTATQTTHPDGIKPFIPTLHTNTDTP